MKALHIIIRPVTFIALSVSLLLSSCWECEDKPVISYFAFEQLSPKVIGEIDQANHNITLKIAESVDVTNLTPTIELGGSDCLSLSPRNRTGQDFSQPVSYEVHNELDETTTYQVSVTKTPDPEDNPFSMEWSSGRNTPLATAWSSAVELNDLFYICGGVDAEGNILNKIQIYDPSNDTWSLASTSMEARRWGHSATTVDGKIYVIGGTNVPQGPAIKDIEQYDPATDTWSIVGEMADARIGHSAIEYEGKIYIMGGEYAEPSLTVLRTLEAYDPSTDTWEYLSPMPTARIFMGACVTDGVIYVLGGGSKYPYPGITSVEAYDIAEDRWEKKTPMRIKLCDLRAGVIDGKIVCMGG
ncbi:MAG: Kelch repeat-containing protein, partial [Bacteroidales bacterium]